MLPDHKTSTRALLLSLITLIAASCGGGGGGGGGGPVTPPPPPVATEWLIPTEFIFDGGPGRDGIPALQNPAFEDADTATGIRRDELAVAIKQDGKVKIYLHDVLDWHEIVNDGPPDDPFSLSYCPLTGSAVAWKGTISHADKSFGVSGLLFNSNLLLYDRETASVWSQMYETAVNGTRIREVPERIQIIEGEYSTLRDMFPGSELLSRNTGFSREYTTYPYGNYRESAGLLYPVTNEDNRMHPKTRIIGIRAGTGVDSTDETKVYQLGAFGDTNNVINDQVGNQSIVVIGNSELNYSVIYNRELADGTILNFSPIDGDGANVMSDDEGNVWDLFGSAVSGPRAGEQLGMTNSYTAYWFAWVAHFPNAEVHFNTITP
jgi:hypothetical protein